MVYSNGFESYNPAEQPGRRAQQRGLGTLQGNLIGQTPTVPVGQFTQRTPERPPMFTPSGQLPLPTITSDTADQLASQGRWQEANQMARQNPDRYRVMNTPTDLGFTGAGTTAGFTNRQSGIFPQVTQYLNPGGGLTSANAAMTGLRPPPQPAQGGGGYRHAGPMPWGMQRRATEAVTSPGSLPDFAAPPLRDPSQTYPTPSRIGPEPVPPGRGINRYEFGGNPQATRQEINPLEAPPLHSM